MKLWPPRFLASARPQMDLDRADEDPSPPLGASGTLNYSGFLQQEEYNQDLIGTRAIDVFERMRRSDASVRETLWHAFAPILNAEWTVEAPAHATDKEQEVAAFVRAAYFEWMNQPFVEYLQHVLLYLVYGHMVFEPGFQIVERGLTVDYTDANDQGGGAPDLTALQVSAAFPNQAPQAAPILQEPIRKSRDIPKRQFVTWRKFNPRLPRTIWKWTVDSNEELESITQYAPVIEKDGTQVYKHVVIPAQFLLVYTNEKWGGEFTGISLLRSIYKAWVLKELIEKIAGIAYERHGVGIPVGYVPRDREDDDAAVTRVEEMLGNLRAGESAYLVFPGPKQQGNINGYQFEIVSPQGGIPDFKTILEYFRGEIAGGLLARFKELGHATTGARATANVQAEVWYNALHAIARYVGDANAPAIRRLVDLNYPGIERYPRLVASNIEARNILEFAQTVALLGNAQALSMDAPTRSWIRSTIDAPGEDPDEAKLRSDAQAKQQKLQDLSLAGIEPNPTETARPRVSKSSTTASDEPQLLD